MNSNYAVIPVNSSIELQHQNNANSLDDPHTKIQSDAFFAEEYTDEIDDFPLIYDGGQPPETAHSGIPGAVFNLAISIIGARIMALPAEMKVLGLGFGFIAIILMGILSKISVEILVRFAVLCKSTSYGEVVESALGRPLRIISEVCIIINNAGVLVVYLIIIGDVMSGSLQHIGVFDQSFGHGIWDHRKMVILVVVLLFLALLGLGVFN